MEQAAIAPEVLVLSATILQSRHAFDASLHVLDRAIALKPNDAQAWLTRATVLRVLGRYQEAADACQHLVATADTGVTMLCVESLRGLTGSLGPAYLQLSSMSLQSLGPEALTWRDSELGEMAERQGNDTSAERWFRDGLKRSPDDLYIRAAYADLLLRQNRAPETLQLLSGYESMEPLLLRVAVAHEQLNDTEATSVAHLLSSAFSVEAQRGDPVHRREQARFFLDVEHRPEAALQAAQDNWRVQREPEDVLILLRAARAAKAPQAARVALSFLAETGMQDARLDPYRSLT